MEKRRLNRALVSGVLVLGILATSRVANAGCKEVSEYVGEQACARYGMGWSVEGRPNIDFRFGFRHAGFSTAGTTFKEIYDEEKRPQGYSGYRFSGEALGVRTLRVIGTDAAVMVYLAGQLYFGFDGGFGFASTDTASFSVGERSFADARGIDVVLLHAGVPIGYRIPLGRASLRGEVLFGGTTAMVTQYLLTEGGPERQTAFATRALIEPRVAGDIWFTQHVTLGVYAGTNLFDPSGGHAFGITLAWHIRAFNGDRSLW
jgi:hypothetical protein